VSWIAVIKIGSKSHFVALVEQDQEIRHEEKRQMIKSIPENDTIYFESTPLFDHSIYKTGAIQAAFDIGRKLIGM
jgi:hypothetical protein